MRARRRGAGQFIAAALFIVFCALLPLLFIPGGGPSGEEQPEGTDTRSLRAELFSRYFNGEIERRSLEPTVDDREGVISCRTLANSILTGLCADGTLPQPSDAQISYFSVVDGGEQIRVMEFSQRWSGDWSNWFSIHIDLDTLEVYRAYISEQAVSNIGDYAISYPTAAGTAGEWFALLGCSGGDAASDAEDPLPAETTDFSQSMETEFEIYYSAPEEAELRYRVYVKFYADEYPSMVRDLMFTLI